MTPEQKRKFNTFFGSAFLGAGLIAWGLTAYFAVTPNPPKPVPVIGAATVDLGSCRSVLGSLGYEATVSDPTVTAYEPLSANPQEQLQKATLAAAVCKLPLKSFCMGDGCERPGLTLVVYRTTLAPRAAVAQKVDTTPVAGAATPKAKAH